MRTRDSPSRVFKYVLESRRPSARDGATAGSRWPPGGARWIDRLKSFVGVSRQIAAENDVDALKAFLARYAESKATFENYREEIERLFLWATGQLGKPISSLTHEDLLAVSNVSWLIPSHDPLGTRIGSGAGASRLATLLRHHSPRQASTRRS